MVGVRVREDDCVNLLDIRFFQLRTQLVAFIHIARIHKDSLLPRLNENGVALPDVQHLDRDRARCGMCRIGGRRRTAARKKLSRKEYRSRKYGCNPLFHWQALPALYERNARLIRNAIETRYMIQLTFLYCPAKSFITV